MFPRQRNRQMPPYQYGHHPYPFPPHQRPGRPYQQYMQQMNPSSQAFGYKPKKTSFLKSAFIGEDGSFDVGRTVQTVDQVVKTVSQVSPIVKQIGSFFLKK
ncbi:YppG family protein [Alkalihalobacillus oceani]|uniref:YppG family protein n=1 Tax=Halalkalibacter oceani TaxID=1653776 RepID=UPI00203E4CD3|nr:YppG family protein [Halalkalibacter oceani]MCM3760716.1 YppG family protein [Halalkalibacter oceani]